MGKKDNVQDGPKPKKQKRLSYEKEQRMVELEAMLFGNKAAQLDNFSKELEQEPDYYARAASGTQGPGEGGEGELMMFEDRRGTDVDPAALSSDEEDEDRQDEVQGSEEEGGGAGPAPQGRGARAYGSEDESGSEDDSEPERQPIGKGVGPIGLSSDDDEPETRESPKSKADLKRDRDVARKAVQKVQKGLGVSGARKPVWEDPDDADVTVNVAARNRLRKLRQTEGETKLSGREYEERLRSVHARMNPRTAWAAAPLERRRRAAVQFGESSDEEDAAEAEGLLTSAGRLLGSSEALPPGLLQATRLKDANQADPNKAVVQSVEFHPEGHLMLTAGLDRRLRFFRVDGVKNPLVQSIFFEDMPVHKAAFADSGAKVIAAGRRKFFYIFDLAAARVDRIRGIAGRQEKSFESFAVSPTATESPVVAFLGNQGYIPLVSLRTRQAVGELKMNGTARTAAFSADGLELVTSGGDGVLHTWDMRTRRCLKREVDEGCLNSTSLALSRDGAYLASGSDSGVVNVYGRSHTSPGLPQQAMLPLAAAQAKPLKTLFNLTTTVDSLAFSPDSQILALGSRMKKDALRLVHLPSFTVFSNWPTSRSPVQYVHSLAFSPGGGLLAIGNARGRVVLYRLHHYPSV